MRLGRRPFLRAGAVIGSASVAGCLSAVDSLVGTGETTPGYIPWLVQPDVLIPATNYRFVSIRPPAISDTSRVDQFRPSLAGTAIDPTTTTRIVAGNGGFAVTGPFEQGTVVAALRDADYDYVDGLGDAWLMAPPTDEHPPYAVGDGYLTTGYPTDTATAKTVAETIAHTRETGAEWTTTDPRIQVITSTLGDPPLLTAGLHSKTQTTAPERGAFLGAVGWGITEHGDGATIAILFAADTTPATSAVESWATMVFDAPTIDTTDTTITIDTTTPPTPWTSLPVPAHHWPMTGATPGHTATVPNTRPPTPPISVNWLTSVRVNGLVTAPITDTDTIYLGVGDLLAIDATDGTPRWRIDTKLTGTPALTADTLYAPIETGVLALNTTDTTTQWHHPTKATRITAPTLAHDTVYVGTTTPTPGIHAINQTDGTTTWTVADTPVEHPVAATDNHIYALDTTDHLHAITLDGTTTWTHPVDTPVQATPVADSTHVYLITTNSVIAIATADGSVDWTTEFTQPLTTPPAVDENAIIVGESRPGASNPGALSALNPDDGSRRWTRQLDNAVVGQPAIAAGTIYVVGAAGSIAAYTLATGDRIWQRGLAGSLRPPTVIDDQLLITTLDGRITSIEPDWIPGPT